MKKFLPTSKRLALSLPKGFTLIELLVVIAIIAVLAVMGFAAFGGLTGKANDDRRAGDIKAIADALEVARAKMNPPSSYYVPIDGKQFSGGTLPQEPTSRAPKYCYRDGAAPFSNPGPNDWGQPTPGACPGAFINLDIPMVPAINPSGCTGGVGSAQGCSASYFQVCTRNEAGDKVICQNSKQ